MGPNPAVIDSRYSWRGSARLLQKMILLSMILLNSAVTDSRYSRRASARLLQKMILSSMILSKTPNPAVIDSRYSWRAAPVFQKMILPIPDFAKYHAIACQRVGAVL